MAGTLGICATNSSSLSHLIGLTKAAVRAGKRVNIFITGDAARFFFPPQRPSPDQTKGHGEKRQYDQQQIE